MVFNGTARRNCSINNGVFTRVAPTTGSGREPRQRRGHGTARLAAALAAACA